MHVNLESHPMTSLFLMLTVAEGKAQPNEAECVALDWMGGLYTDKVL